MLVLVLAGAVPLLLSLWPPLEFWHNIRALFYSLAAILILFGAWDVFATYRGHWQFSPHGVWAFRVVNLPLEEVLFFVVIPFCCIFTWEAINYLAQKRK